MMVASTLSDEQRINIERLVEINAPIEIVYESILEQLSSAMETHGGNSMEMKLEAWPGGRWFRDLGNNAGHFWGHVQVIKPPTLLEITGPMFMSYPVASHVQYKLTAQGTGTQLKFCHRAFGDIDPQHAEGVSEGWGYILGKIKERAEK